MEDMGKNEQMSDHDLLVRIDERTRSFHENVDKRITGIEYIIDKKLVTRNEFKPVKLIVYSAVSILGTGLLVGILGLLID